jgi:hypothetical protein
LSQAEAAVVLVMDLHSTLLAAAAELEVLFILQ